MQVSRRMYTSNSVKSKKQVLVTTSVAAYLMGEFIWVKVDFLMMIHAITQKYYFFSKRGIPVLA